MSDSDIKITAITCTGDRVAAFGLCQKYMRRQTRQPDRWIVVDDGPTRTMCGLGQEVIRLEPMAGHSLKRNLRAALSHVWDNPLGGREAVAFVEDDDWYAPWWIERVGDAMVGRYGGGEPLVVGEGQAVYYNVRRRRSCQWMNVMHASLASTAIRRALIPAVLEHCLKDDQCNALVDWRIWNLDCRRRLWLPDVPRQQGAVGTQRRAAAGVVGMKAMPGRGGIAGGHADADTEGWLRDPTGEILCYLLGNEDANNYWQFIDSREVV